MSEDIESIRREYEAQIADLKRRLEEAEREIARLKGVAYEPPPAPQGIPLAPFDSPVHDELIKACMQGNESRVVELINQGANPNHKDALDSTPLHWAAQGGHDRIIPILLAAGANPKAKNIKKLTPQEVAAGRAKNKDVWKVPKKK